MARCLIFMHDRDFETVRKQVDKLNEVQLKLLLKDIQNKRANLSGSERLSEEEKEVLQGLFSQH